MSTDWRTGRGARQLVPQLQTVLANEQVGWRCERCKTRLQRKTLRSGFQNNGICIRLGLPARPDWPEKTKKIQQNWIGKVEGTEIDLRAPTELQF